MQRTVAAPGAAFALCATKRCRDLGGVHGVASLAGNLRGRPRWRADVTRRAFVFFIRWLLRDDGCAASVTAPGSACSSKLARNVLVN